MTNPKYIIRVRQASTRSIQGVLDMPEVEEYSDNVVLDSRQGVAVEYLESETAERENMTE